MISLSHEAIFVHVPKCAGQSVEAAFCADLGLEWEAHRHLLGCFRRVPAWQPGLPRQLAHLSAAEYRDSGFVPAAMFARFYKFAVVRDPLDRVVSSWRYGGSRLPFGLYVDLVVRRRKAQGHHFMRSQKAYVCAPGSDAVLVDEIIPFSDLPARWPALAARLGVSAPLGHRNRSAAGRPRPAVTPAIRRRIEALYAEDYAFFARF